MKNKQVITTGKQSRRDYRSVERNTPTQSGMPSGMPPVIMDAFLTECRVRRERCVSTIFPTGMGQSANNLLQVIYFTLLKQPPASFNVIDATKKVKFVRFCSIMRIRFDKTFTFAGKLIY
jgi:hypothetical protein